MAYFDGLAQKGLNKDERGRQLFFPFGKMGKGYVLETETAYLNMLTFNKRRYMAMLILSLAIGIIFQWKLSIIATVAVFITVIDYIAVKFKVKNLEHTVNKFDAQESQKRSARVLGLPVLIICVVIMVLMLLLGILLLMTGKDPIIAVATIIIFGGIAYLGVRQIRLVIKEKAVR